MNPNIAMFKIGMNELELCVEFYSMIHTHIYPTLSTEFRIAMNPNTVVFKIGMNELAIVCRMLLLQYNPHICYPILSMN